MAWSPSGLSGPGGTTRGSQGFSLIEAAVGIQVGLTRLRAIRVGPVGVAKPSLPTPIA